MIALLAACRVLTPATESEPAWHKKGWIGLFFAALVLQSWSGFYTAFFTMFLLGLASLVGSCFHDSRQRLIEVMTQHKTTMLLAAAVSLAAVLPLATAHLGAAQEVGWRSYATVERALPTWQSWVFTGRSNLLYRDLNTSDVFDLPSAPGQHSNGVGMLTLVVCLVGLLKERRRPVVRTLLITTLAAVLLSTKLWGNFALWEFIHAFLPGAGAVRYVARIGMFLVIPAGVGLASFLAVPRDGWRWVAAGIIATACLSEQLHGLRSHDDEEYQGVVQRIAAEIEPGSDAFFLTTTVTPTRAQRERRTNPKMAHILGMWIGIEAGMPTVNGRYGNMPPGWELENVEPSTESEERTLDRNLERWMRLHHLTPRQIDRLAVPPSWLEPAR